MKETGINYIKNQHRKTYSFEMSLPVFFCDEVVPVMRVLVLNMGCHTNASKKKLTFVFIKNLAQSLVLKVS